MRALPPSEDRALSPSATEPLRVSAPAGVTIPSADTYRDFGVCCDNCRFGYHWEETRQQRERTWKPVWGGLSTRMVETTSPCKASGVQCLRWPEFQNTDADHWCGEYQPAQRIEAGTAETAQPVPCEAREPDPEGGAPQ